MKNKTVKKIIACILAEILMFGPVVSLIEAPAYAANEEFAQTDWIDGAVPADSGVHPTNKTGWTKYSSKDTYINTSLSGKILGDAELLSTSDTTDAHFAKGTRDDVNITGTGSEASLALDSTLDDPFASNLNEFTTLPEQPRLDHWSGFIRVRDPSDSKYYIYTFWSNKTFARFSVENETWEFLADTPAPFGLGCAMAYPGSGDTIYALRGANTTDFWKYSISSNTWTKMSKSVLYPVGGGGSITFYGTNTIYCVPGNSSNKFLSFNITGDFWTELSPASYTVDKGGSLVYPGSGEYVYLNPYNERYSCRYKLTSPIGWSTIAAAPARPVLEGGYAYLNDMCYPGTGNYLYAWSINSNKTLARLDFTQATPTWTDLTDTGRLPVMVRRAILYHPGTGTKLKLLTTENYSRVYNFETSTGKWDEPCGPAYGTSHGCDFLYDGSQYMYHTFGGASTGFWRYSPSADTWERKANTPASIYNSASMTYLDGAVYLTRGYNSTSFYKYDTGTDIWSAMASTPAALTSYGSGLCTNGTYIYALGGANTNKFWRYTPDAGTGSWDDAAVDDAPATIYTGGAIVYVGGNSIYAARGNSTKTFWKYTINTNAWTQMADAPFRFNYKGRLVYPGSGDYIYAFFGENSQFARYKFTSPNADTWQILEPTPTSQSYYYNAECVGTKVYFSNQDRTLYVFDTQTLSWSSSYVDGASFLDYYSSYNPVTSWGNSVYTGADTVYLFTGRYTSHIWKYSLSQKKWTGFVRAKDPSTDRPIFFGPGSKAAYPGSGNYIYLIEGNGTNRFWRYDFVNDIWLARAGPEESGQPLRFYQGSQMSAGGDVIYVCQGRDITVPYYATSSDERSYKFLRYTISTNTWQVSAPATSLTDLPNYIYNSGYETGNKLLYIPSLSQVYFLRDQENYFRIYDINSYTWSTSTNASPMTIYAYNGSCMFYRAADNSVYLYSGRSSNKLFKYAIGTGVWTELSTHNRYSYLTPMDADIFSTGDIVYVNDGISGYLIRYSLSKNDWDTPATLPYNYSASTYAIFSEGADGDTLYSGGYRNFYSYSLSTRSWKQLSDPYTTTGLAWTWSYNGGQQMVYFSGDRDSLYATRGAGYSNFVKYKISTNVWSDCVSPGTFGYGHCFTATSYKVYCLMGGGITAFKSYDPNVGGGTWSDETAFPATVYSGSALCYVSTNNTIYAARGYNTRDFYKYNVGNRIWTKIADIPASMRFSYAAASLAYPGKGDYVYLLAGSTYGTVEGYTYNLFRFNINTEAWEEVSAGCPVAFRNYAKIVYPGQDQYLYAWRGYETGYDLFKFLVFKEGTYTSEVKAVGRNKEYDIATWTDNGKGTYELKARTSTNSAMTGAVDWSTVAVRKKGEDLSDSYPAVKNKDTYAQYRLKLFTDDLTKLPQLDALTLKYYKYPVKQELISSPYDTTYANNRLMKLSWSETQPTGTDVRFQLKSASTKAGLSSASFLGPGGTQSFNDNYSTDGDYARADSIEVAGGVAKLKKLLQDYLYTQRIVLDNTEGTVSYTDIAAIIEITSSNKHFWDNVKSDGSDVRFVDQSGNLLAFNNSAAPASWDYANKYAKVLVKISSLPAASKLAIFLKYGKSDALSASDPAVCGKKLSSTAAYEGGNSGDYQSAVTGGFAGTKPVAVATTIGTYDDSVSGYDTNWNAGILAKDLVFLYGRNNAEVVTALDNGAIVVLSLSAYNSLKAFLGITEDNIYTSRGYSTRYFAHSDGYAFGVVETNIMGCDWEHYTVAQIESRGLNIKDTILNLPNAGSVGSDVYIGAIAFTNYISLYENKATSPSLSGWEYRQEIEVDDRQGADLTAYQVKVELTKDHESFWSRCREDGYDVRFVDENNTTVLSYYRQSFDYANKTASFWVKMPALSAGAVRKVYLYYGRADASDVSSYAGAMTKNFDNEIKDHNLSAVSLDGTDDKIIVAHSTSLNASSAVSIEANLKYMADTWLPGFAYRKKVTIDNTSGPAYSNIPVQFDVGYVADKMDSAYADIRFVDTDGTKLAYRIASYDASKATVIVIMPSIPAASNKDIYLYYGNDTATSENVSGIGSTAEFSGTSINTDKFTYGGGSVTQNDFITFKNDSGDSWDCYLTTVNTYARAAGTTFQAKFKGDSGARAMIGWHDSGTGPSFTDQVYSIYFNNGSLYVYEDGNSRGNLATYTLGQWYDVKIVLKSVGATYYYKLSSSDSWTQIYDSGYSSETSLKASICHFDRDEQAYTDDWHITDGILGAIVHTPAFAAEEAQPAISQTIISKSGAYELKFGANGLAGYINGVERAATPMYDAGKFMHAAMTYDRSNVLLYVNGVLKASSALTAAITTNSNDVIVGDGLKGAIDEVRLWNICRKAGSILENKEKVLIGTETGLKCYLKCNENTGTTAVDATVNANNGALSGTPAWLGEPFSYVNEKSDVIYHMDEGVGSTTADISGNNNTLVLSNTTWPSPTQDLTGFTSNTCVKFDGNVAYGSVTDNASLDITGKVTIEAWIKPEVNVGTGVIVDKGNDATPTSNYKLYQSGDKIVFSFYNGSEKVHQVSTGFILSNTTYHVAATFDEAADLVKIYIDGAESYSNTEISSMVTNSDALRIGKAVSAATAFKGLIDEVRIYKRALSAEEIKCHYEHRLYALSSPGAYNVYVPPQIPEVGTYADNNPVIQPVMGVFYTNKNILQFQEITTKPDMTDIKYQVSYDGYRWYWFDGENWSLVESGYSQANSEDQINDNLGAFQDLFPDGDFYYRAYFHSEPSSYKTPSLDNVAVTLVTGQTYYTDPAGSTAINTLHTDADQDRWYQYKAIIYSDGEDTAMLDDVNLEYINSYITVLTPNGSEMLTVGTNYDITWNSQAIQKTTGNVKIEYTTDGSNYTTISASAPNTGSYSWQVPDTASTNCQVRISSVDFPVVSDSSNNNFTILSVKVISPNGAEIWEQGKSHNVTWIAAGNVPNNLLKLEYSIDGGSSYVAPAITSTAIAPSGSYAWTIPAVASDQVKLKISETTGQQQYQYITDASDAVFSIVPAPSISISAPAGTESWLVGEEHSLTWSANSLNFADEVVLEYSSDDFAGDVNQIAQVSIGTGQGTNNNDDILGTYVWTVPDAVSDNIRVRIREASIPAGRDTQTAVTAISPAISIIQPVVTITGPVAADIWVAGDTHNIEWTSSGSVSNDLLLEYSTDGETYTEIATGEANDGTYDWVIPSEASGNAVYIRITDNERTAVTDVSEAFHVLSGATLQVTNPNGSEELTIGTSHNITWTSYGVKLQSGGADYSKINIYYSTDNGANWYPIAYHTNNTGSYSWSSVPDAETTEGLIKITDDNDALVVDTSDANFSIVPPSITVTSPNGTELWYATGQYHVTWSTVGTISDNLTLEYSSNGGTSWNAIAAGVDNNGDYLWSSAADVDSSSCLVRITDAARPVVADASNSSFTIAPPTITITAPNGGEELAVGTAKEITWVSVGSEVQAIRNNLTIQYSYNNGASWNTIATGEANDGSYSWSVPDTIFDLCLVKIFDATRAATSDVSDATFKIALPYVRITSPNGGELWPIGTQKDITWTSVGTISNNLKIEYSKDNFVTATQIPNGSTLHANSGTYAWTIPDDYAASVKIRITDTDRPAVTDSSDAVFSIVNPIINITAPNGAELWTVGDVENITWQNEGSVGSTVEILYSKDNFVSDSHTINASAPNSGASGTYAWTLPSDVSASVRIKITDTGRTTVWDKSNANFTILPVPVITIDAPAEGELWRVGTQKDITWSDNGGNISNNLKLEYSINSGSTWTQIANGISNSGSYTWTVPDNVSATCKIRITDNIRLTTTAETELFAIGHPLIAITSPNGGEYWAVAESAPITWTTEGTISDNLVMEYSSDNGSTYNLIKSGEANDGSYTWTVPDDVSPNCLFRISDGNRPATYDVSNNKFTILTKPVITITLPNGSEVYVLGDEVPVTWTWKGLSISDNLVFEASSDNFVTTKQVVATGEANDGSFTWILTGSTMTGSTVKLRITDGNRTEVTDMSDGYFRVRGGFTLTKPNGGEYWGAKSPQTITWDTRGNIPYVKLEYSTDNGSTWNVIAASVPNVGSYSWIVPDIQASQVKVRVSDTTDATTSDDSNNKFDIIYFTVKFNALDYDTLQHLSELNVNEPSTSWSDTGVTSPIERTTTYPYGTYTTFFTKTNYIDNSVTWSTPKEGNTPYVVTAYLENSASAQVTWESILSYSYAPADDTLNAVGSLQRKGKLVGTTELERLDMGAAVVTVYEPDGTTIRKTLTATAPNSSGTYSFAYANTEFEAGKVYPTTLSVTYRERPYISTANIDVGAEKLQYEFFTKSAKQLTESVAVIEQAVAGGTAQTRADIEASRQQLVTDVRTTEATLKTHVSGVLTAAETAIKANVEQARALTESAMKSQILNTESAIRTGETLAIRYRTYSTLAPSIDVYGPDNVLLVSKGTMKEIGTTGIYEYDLQFLSGWGKGDFTIVCSESTKGTLDALTMTVISTDIEQVAGQVAGILGTTSGISDLGNVADTMSSQFGVIESALSKMGKDMINEVKEAAANAGAFESVYDQLSTVAKQIKKIGGDNGVNLEKLYEVSAGKKQDMTYLKNKTQELKAAMEINSKLVDNIANKPVVQTWYEYK